MNTRPILMSVRPLWLREKVYYRFYSQNVHINISFNCAPLEFARQVSMELLSTDVAHRAIAFLGFYELPVTRKIMRLAHQGGIMIDVGANYGYYSCLWAASRTSNRVIAFEASPKVFPSLRSNLIRNRLTAQVEAFQVGVGNQSQILPFDLGPAEQSGWGGFSFNGNSDVVDIEMITLDDFAMRDSQIIDVLKIDVEGADTWVLQGAENLLRARRIRHVFFEENVGRMANLGLKSGTAQRLLQDCGYRVESIGRGEWYGSI